MWYNEAGNEVTLVKKFPVVEAAGAGEPRHAPE